MKDNANPKSALHEKDGIPQPESFSASAMAKVLTRRKVQPSAAELVNGILAGDISALSRAITLVESTNPLHLAKANDIISACLPHANQSVRIGITGVPGVGKSTFIEAFGKYLTGLGKKVAVLAVDPSSSISHGSILGDKTRMNELSQQANAFIRPSPAGSSLGGVARTTRESILICEAAGFDVILIETVGVGQSETAVHSMADFFLLLMLAGAGDELQGIKRGIMEMADGLVITKADGDNVRKANAARQEYQNAMHLFPPTPSGWIPKAMTCSALEGTSISFVRELIDSYVQHTQANGFFVHKRAEQDRFWMLETLKEAILADFFENKHAQVALKASQEAVVKGEISSFEAAEKLYHAFKEGRFGND